MMDDKTKQDPEYFIEKTVELINSMNLTKKDAIFAFLSMLGNICIYEGDPEYARLEIIKMFLMLDLKKHKSNESSDKENPQP
jgi:hypothetical protein